MAKIKSILNYPNNLLNKISFNKNYLNSSIGDHIRKKCNEKFNQNNSKGLTEMISDVVLSVGFIKLPNLDENFLNNILSEYNYLINNYKKLNVDFQEEEGVCVRAVPIWNLNPKNFHYSFNFFKNNFFYEIAEIFFKEKNIENFSFNNDAFFHKTTATKKPLSGAYHYDIRPTLKFWLYLNDIHEKNGPMSVEKNSSKKNQNLNQKKINDGINLVEVNDNNCEKVIGTKGTILIHDTNSSHKANNVDVNEERNIIRAHSWQI